MALFCAEGVVCPWPDPFLYRITAFMGSMMAGAGLNPAVLACRIKDPFVVMQDPIAYLFCHDAST